jgi:flagellar biosynthesis/type III secretory pathway protein FliH
MLSATFEAQARAIPYPAAPTSRWQGEARAAALVTYREAHKALDAAFAAALAEEYLSDIAESRRAPIAAQTFSLAWEAGHSAGYSDVENHYIEFADFAVAVYGFATS